MPRETDPHFAPFRRDSIFTDAEIEQLYAELESIPIERAVVRLAWMLGAFGIAALGIAFWLV